MRERIPGFIKVNDMLGTQSFYAEKIVAMVYYYLGENEHRLALFGIIVVAYVINGGYAIHNIKFIDVGKQFPYAFKRVRVSLYK